MKKSFTQSVLRTLLGPVLGPLLCFFTTSTVKAVTTYTVTVQNYSFSPSTVNCHVGDIIVWQWVGGTHTTTSTSVPAGANTWSSSINSSTTSFTYTVTIAGTYNYQCNFHFSMGMVGVLNVTAATSTPSVNEPAVSKYYPNPVHGVLNLEFNSNLYSGIIDISVSDMLGREVNKQQITVMPKQEANYPVDFSSLAPGNYIVKLRQADNEIGAVKIAKE